MITVEELMVIAYGKDASDIHITVGAPPKMRVLGQLENMKFPVLNAYDTETIISSVMTKEQKENFLKNGEFEFSYEVKNVGRCRVSVFKQKGYTGAVLRLVKNKIKNPLELGLPSEVINLYQKKKGLILFAGPVGSGKSTVVASLLDMVNENRSCHILTLEEPIEYVHKHKAAIVNQREVGVDTASYKEGLKYALREDADVIYIEEFSDPEVIEQALKIAESGKLVISIVNNFDSVSVIERIISAFPIEKRERVRLIFSEVLVCIISRQLLHEKNGNKKAVYEILEVNEDIRNSIQKNEKEFIYSKIKKIK